MTARTRSVFTSRGTASASELGKLPSCSGRYHLSQMGHLRQMPHLNLSVPARWSLAFKPKSAVQMLRRPPVWQRQRLP